MLRWLTAALVAVFALTSWRISSAPTNPARTEHSRTRAAPVTWPESMRSVADEGLPPAASSARSAPSRAQRSPVPAEPADRHLRVRTFLDGDPLPNTEVFALAWTAEMEALAARDVGLPASAIERAARGTTDRNGAVELVVGPNERVLVAARGPGSAPHAAAVAGTEEAIRLDLPPEQTIFGSAWRWPEKTRLPDARVRARRAYMQESRQGDAFDPLARTAGMFFWSETRTDGDGLYRLGGLPAGRVFVIGSFEGRAANYWIDRILPVDEPIPLSLIAGVDLAGTVLDDESGEPLEGVEVAGCSIDGGRPGWEADTTFTDAAGRFEVSAPIDGDHPFGVTARCDGFVPVVRTVATAGPFDVSLRLRRATSLEVTVVDGVGAPIPDARVFLLDFETSQTTDHEATDAEGRGHVALDPDHPWWIHVEAEGFAARTVGGDHLPVLPLTVALEPTGVLEGTVTSAGAPVGRAAVRARLDIGLGQWESDDRVETSPLDGSFRIDGLRSGRYVVDVHAPDDAPGHAPARRVVWIEPGETRSIDVPLPRGADVFGVVRAASTRLPIAGATVSVAERFSLGDVSGPLPDGATTDASGRFVLSGVPPGLTPLLIEHEAYVSFSRDVEAGPGAPPVEFLLQTPGVVVVRMVRSDSAGPVPFHAILDPASSPERSARTSTGEVRFEALPPGRVVVSARPERTVWNGRALTRWFSDTVDLAAGETRTLEFTLEEGATVRGTVDFPPGLGLSPSDATVLVAPAARRDSWGNGVPVGHDGRFELPMVPAGDTLVNLFVRTPRLSLSEVRRVRLARGETREIRFRPPVSGVRGKVADRFGRGVRGVGRVRGTDANDRRWVGFPTADDGTFRHLVPPGPIEWVFTAEGFGSRVGRATIADARTLLDLPIVLRPEARLLVRVVGLDDEPVDSATVTLRPLDLPEADRATTTQAWGDGRWLVRRIGDGPHRLEVDAPGFVGHHDDATFASGDRRESTVRLRRTIDLSLAAFDRRGAPLLHETVRFEPIDADDLAAVEARTDGAGRLVVRLAEAAYDVVARDERHRLDLVGDAGPIEATLELD